MRQCICQLVLISWGAPVIITAELAEEKAALGKKRKRLSKEEVASPTKVLKTSTDESQANRGSGNRTRSQRVKSANEEEGQRSRTRVMQVPVSNGICIDSIGCTFSFSLFLVTLLSGLES